MQLLKSFLGCMEPEELSTGPYPEPVHTIPFYLSLTTILMQKGHIICHWEIMSRTWVGHVARMGEKTNEYRILVGKAEGRRRRRVDNVKIGVRER